MAGVPYLPNPKKPAQKITSVTPVKKTTTTSSGLKMKQISFAEARAMLKKQGIVIKETPQQVADRIYKNSGKGNKK